MKNNIVVLGSTGSIGKQTLDVIKQQKLNVLAISAKTNVDLLEDQARIFKPEYVSVVDEDLYSDLKFRLRDLDVKVLAGEESLCELASLDKSEMVINSVVGVAGLMPTLCAVEANKIVGLANKESLVVAGQLIVEKIKFKNQLMPIDSEHSAIFQALHGNARSDVDKIILTASGGPFFGKKKEDLVDISVAQALAHPNWSMGKKILIDSATLMNKGLELIEAMVLFNVAPQDVQIVIHRESIIHSMVSYVDGSVIAQLSVPDMRVPIQYVISYPNRVINDVPRLDFCKLKNLSFFEPDLKTFECLQIAKDVAERQNVFPCVLNAANEEAVNLFLNGKIKFLEIAEIVKKALENQQEIEDFGLKDIFEIDKKTRDYVNKTI